MNEAEKQAQNHAVTISGTPASVAAAAGGGSLGSSGSSGSPPAAVSAAVMAAAVAAESAAMLEAANRRVYLFGHNCFLSLIRYKVKTTLTRFCLLLTTYLPFSTV